MLHQSRWAFALALVAAVGGCSASDGGPRGGQGSASSAATRPATPAALPTDSSSWQPEGTPPPPTEEEAKLIALVQQVGATEVGRAEQGFGPTAAVHGTWQGGLVEVIATSVDSPSSWDALHDVDLGVTSGRAVTPPGGGVAVAFSCSDRAFTAMSLGADGSMDDDETRAIEFATALADEVC